MDTTTTPATTIPSVEELLQQISTLIQELNLLKQQQQQSTTPSTIHSSFFSAAREIHSVPATHGALFPFGSHSGIKVSPPEPFDGSMQKAETFLSQLKLYFYGKGITDELQRVVYALSYMNGRTAGKWALDKTKILDGDHSKEGLCDDFVYEFREVFGDPDPASTARHKMNLLKQENQTTNEYVASFRELASDTGYNDAALVGKFQTGLNRSLRKKVCSVPEMPRTLNSWISCATRLDRQWRQMDAFNKSSSSSSSPFSRAPTSQKPQSKPTTPSSFLFSSSQKSFVAQAKQPDVVPMEVDSGWKSVRPLICFKCRKQGHKAADCRSSVNINAMNHEELKDFYGKLIKEEEGKKEESQQNF